MSNSTNPSDKNGKKSGKAGKANKDRNTEFAQNTAPVAETDKNTASDNKKSISSPMGMSTSSVEPTNADLNDKNKAKAEESTLTDKIVEVEPETVKPTDKITEISPEDVKTAEKSAAIQSEKTTERVIESPLKDAKPADKNTGAKTESEKDIAPKPETKSTVNMNKSDTATPSIPAKSSNSGTTLSIIAIALVIGLGAGLYYHGHTQSKLQQATIQSLQDKLDKLEPQLAGIQQGYSQLSNNKQDDQIIALQKQLQDQLKQQQQAIADVQKESAAQLEQFKALQSKVSTLSTTEANLWLLAEADFLVKQAVRKLNTEKDITTAIALLSSADASIRDMNDPSLHELRSAIAKDITALSSIQRVDIDGTVIKIYQLSDQLDNMVLIKNQLEDDMSETENLEVSDDINDWKSNLSKSWKGFIADFITITPVDSKISDTNKPELTANQGAYLRENIRLQLLIAAQAVPTYQSETYNQALAKAMSWVKEYYAADNPINQAFINELAQLQKQNIQVNVPAQLSSQPLLNKQVEVRLRSLLTQNASSGETGE